MSNSYKKLRSNRVIPLKESGVSLLVVLVMMVSMTILAISTTDDSYLQSQMVKDDQFRTSAYQAAYSEINAQLGVINSNDSGEIDQLILDLYSAPVKILQKFPDADLAGPHKNEGPFNQSVSYRLACKPADCPSPPGFSLSGVTKVIYGTIESQAEVINSSISSDQTQTFWYLIPQDGDGRKTW